jgi:putative ABC transport system permease protein
MTAGGNRWTAGRLLRRRFGTRPAASILVAVIATATVLGAAVIPRLIEQQATAELTFQLQSIGVIGRSLQGASSLPEDWAAAPSPNADQLFNDLQSSFDDGRSAMPQPLRRAVGTPSWILQTPAVPSDQVGGAARTVGLRLTADRSYLKRIRIVQGTAPAVWSQSESTQSEQSATTPVDVILSVQAATRLKITSGEVIGTDEEGGVPQRLYRVTGLFEPRDPGDDYWTENPSLLPTTTMVPEHGAPYLTAAAYVDPQTVGRIAYTFADARISMYYPLSATGLDGADAGRLQSELSAVKTTGIPLSDSRFSMSIVTRSDQAAQTAVDRDALLAGLLALLAAAPLGVVLAVLVLGVQVVVRSRRTDLLLASARGGSDLQLRGAMAIEGALLSVPAAIVVMVIATLVIHVRPQPIGVILPALVALAPPALFAALAVTRERAGVIGRTLGALRPVAEMAVVLLAALSLFLLVRRGLAQATIAVGVDPLLSVAPLLLAVSAGIIVVRGFPLLMRTARGAAARSRGLPAFIGSIQLSRAPTIGLAGVLALVVGVSVSLFSTVLLTTFDAGIQSAASESVGADARIDAAAITPGQESAVGHLGGVRDTAGLDYLSSLAVEKASIADPVTLILAETRPLGSMRALPSGLTAEVGGRVPVVVSSDLLHALGAQRTLTLGGVKLRVTGSLPAESGLGPTVDWVIADSSFAKRFSTAFTPETLLIRADHERLPLLQAPLEHAMGADKPNSGTTVLTVPTATAERHDEPAVRGVVTGLILGAALSVLLCATALVLSTVAAGAARGRTSGILRTLGMPRRRLRTLIAWELVPVAVVTLVAGTVLGIALPFVVASAVDLRVFTGSLGRAVPVIDPVLLLAVLAGFAVVVAASGLVAVLVSGRANPSSTLKMGAS